MSSTDKKMEKNAMKRFLNAITMEAIKRKFSIEKRVTMCMNIFLTQLRILFFFVDIFSAWVKILLAFMLTT